ncbi:MAG: aminoglycoside phosphotransferase family protein [Acidimicrobiaceae bacterium]|nr:aminoglycoside phosphotransferase family protein [Acidimicrobiaceae bacterium]
MTGPTSGDASQSPRLRSPAHGFCDDEESRRLLRSRPPEAALRWVEQATACPVVSVRTLRGGMSSAVHRLTLEASSPRFQVVLRRYVRHELNAEEPDLAAREARALRFVESVPLPTPRLIAVDPTGAEAGVPALLMTALPGKVDWWPTDLERWLRSLARVLPTIHGASPPPPGLLPAYAPYRQSNYRPPPWARWPQVWERAVELALGPAPDLPVGLVQRDFHPGNVLWRHHRISGVVDWQAASVGPAVVDVAHCRVNLLGFDRAVAERFTALWSEESGTEFHPWADIAAIVDFLDDLHSDWGSEKHLLEDVLADAVAELG